MIKIVGKGYKFILKQLDDFCGVVNPTVISLKSAEGIKKYEEVFERKIPQKVKNIRTRILSVFQTRLTDFLDDTISFFKRKIRLPYKTKPSRVNEQYLSDKLPDDHRIAFNEYTTFHGYLGNLFMLNPSIDNYFLDLQLKLRYEPQLDFLNLNNIFKLEVARCKLGRPHFNSWIDEINYNEPLKTELGIQSKFKITERSYIRNINEPVGTGT